MLWKIMCLPILLRNNSLVCEIQIFLRIIRNKEYVHYLSKQIIVFKTPYKSHLRHSRKFYSLSLHRKETL